MGGTVHWFEVFTCQFANSTFPAASTGPSANVLMAVWLGVPHEAELGLGGWPTTGPSEASLLITRALDSGSAGS